MDSYNIGKEYAVYFKTDSKGSQPKFFKDEYWYKINNTGNEGLTEELTTVLLKNSNIKDFVSYEQCIINGKKGCRSKTFLKPNEIFVTYQKLYQSYAGGNLSDKISFLSTAEDRFEFLRQFIKTATGLDCAEYLQNNLALDMIILNPDRHFHNLGVIVNAEGKYREAPIFDNGQGLFQNFNITPPGLSKEEKIENLFSATISGSFETQVQASGSILKIDYEGVKTELSEYPDSIAKQCLLEQLEKYKKLFQKEKSLFEQIMDGKYNHYTSYTEDEKER